MNEASKLKRKFEHRGKDAESNEFVLTFDTPETSSSSAGAQTESPDNDSPDDILSARLSNESEKRTPSVFIGNSMFTFLEGNKWAMPDVIDLDASGPSDALMQDSQYPQAPWNGLQSMVLSPNLFQDQLFDVMHRSMFPSQQSNAIPSQLRMHGNWFLRLPPMTGKNKLLDSAMRAVSLAHMGRLQGSQLYLEEARPWYGNTLRQLNTALADNEIGLAPETLAATILLSFYEMFSSNSNASWIQHAGGAGALMRVRGPEVHRYGFNREMYIAYRHTIIIEACQRDEPCFLAEPEWRQLAIDIHNDIGTLGEDSMAETVELANMQYENMLDVPELLHRCKHFRSLHKAELDTYPTLQEFVGDLIRRCQELRGRFKIFFVRFRAAVTKTGLIWTTYLSHDPVIPVYYQFPNIFVGSSVTGYWTINILLNIVLLDLMKSQPSAQTSLYRAESRDSAMELCRSVRYMLSSSFLGPFFIIFGLRVAVYSLQEKEEREWVIARLFEIGQTHMAMAAHIPGFEAGADLPRVRAALVTTQGEMRQLEEIGD